MRVLILGGSGMLGHRIWLACQDRFDSMVTLHGSLTNQPWRSVFDPTRTIEGVDLADDAALGAVLLRARPNAVINAAGLVKQRRLGQDLLAATVSNALLPHRIAAFCAAGEIRLIHLSTDCVFSGFRGNYQESDLPDPVDIYGRSKLLGEVTGPGQLTLRKSAIGRELAERQGLLEWFLTHTGGQVRGFTNAIFSGLTTDVIAKTIVHVLEERPTLEGLWHLAGPAISKHDLLVALRDALGIRVEIEPDESIAMDRSLDDTRFREETAIPRPTWEEMISELASDPLPYETLRGESC